MFYYRITTTKHFLRRDLETITRHTEVREFLHPAHLGEYVASLVTDKSRRIVIDQITQEAYRSAVEARERDA